MPLQKRTLALFLLLSFMLTSCEFKCSVGNTDEENQQKGKPDDKNVVIKNGTALFNGIQLDTKGSIKVQRVYLVNSENKRIDENNFVSPNETVKMVLMIDSGWTEEAGQCYLGASQKVVTDAGVEILNEPDLFASSGVEGISPKDATVITMSVILKIPANAPPNGFNVTFRVWDKKGPAEITGRYKLNTK